MDIASHHSHLLRTLKKDKYNDTRDKLYKLLLERKIPYLLSSDKTDEMEIIKPIGEGAFGIVQLVRYRNRIYAHKRPRSNLSKSQNSLLDEAIKLTDIVETHPNIQRLYFINLKTFGFLMDYCCGGSLETYIVDSNSTYTLTDALNWSYQLADALSFLHSKQIMHRDVKMQNILLKDNYQTLVLTDYGTATQLGRSLLTNQVGTPIIMAPEVCTSTKYTEKCDIYSWAVVFNQILAKQYDPYGEPNLNSFGLIMKITTENFRPRKLNNCPSILVALMYRSWHSDPNERPTLFFIKKVLRLILNVLPIEKQKCSKEIINDNKKQWMNECNLSQKHLLNGPRLDNKDSVNIYQDCLRKAKHITDVQKDRSEMEQTLEALLKEKDSKTDHHKQLLIENEKLQQQIELLREKILHEKRLP
ncbi:unnamed protein product [Adineta steineri]|uniref:Protein kinase domain-containing protein n=1 Tax=Adineta steineri TaxID=433720 RepID=A0A814XPB9_9BILA|nr:unnamed protein product [Adineta steineri]CAF3705234.1 unnamed protein product [Adineta steineri]